MQPTRFVKVLLMLSGLLAMGIGLALVIAPSAIHASDLGTDANLLSEIRAPGGALAGLGLLMLTGAFVSSLTTTSTLLVATVYLSYGLARVVSLALDGTPGNGLLVATGLELFLGLAALGLLARSKAKRRSKCQRAYNLTKRAA